MTVREELIKDLVAHRLFNADYLKLKEEDKATVNAVVKQKRLL